MSIPERIEAAWVGQNPTVIGRLSSGWLVLCDYQFFRGYCLLLADPVVPDLNTLDPQGRAEFLVDMATVGDVLLEVTGAYRINYAIMGNTDPFLHAHIVPRYSDEPDECRVNHPWSYPAEMREAHPFDASRDRELMDQIAAALRRRV
jgi:diadenosine tetraphosphate (Ap4A) HIT family hydrolase